MRFILTGKAVNHEIINIAGGEKGITITTNVGSQDGEVISNASSMSFDGYTVTLFNKKGEIVYRSLLMGITRLVCS